VNNIYSYFLPRHDDFSAVFDVLCYLDKGYLFHNKVSYDYSSYSSLCHLTAIVSPRTPRPR